VCVDVCMWVWVHVGVHVCMWVCVYMCMCVCVCVHVCLSVGEFKKWLLGVSVLMCVICVCMCVICVCMCDMCMYVWSVCACVCASISFIPDLKSAEISFSQASTFSQHIQPAHSVRPAHMFNRRCKRVPNLCRINEQNINIISPPIITYMCFSPFMHVPAIYNARPNCLRLFRHS
jgi:hypothetical protein